MKAALDLLVRLHALGVRLDVDDGDLVFDAPRGTLHQALRVELRSQKRALIALLDNPRQAAQAAWSTAVNDVAASWNRFQCEHGFAPWPDAIAEEEENRLSEAVGATIRAADLPAALRGIALWRRAWLGFLDEATKVGDANASGNDPGSGEPPRIRAPP